MSNENSLPPGISKVLISKEQIQRRVEELGRKISADFQGEELIVVGILRGAFLFMADLVRQIDCPLKTEFMAVSSYGDATTSSGIVRIIKDLDESVEGKNILIVEDIVDTGLTLSYLTSYLQGRSPKRIKICVLCNKPQCHIKPVQIDYTGFQLPEEFVVGYGLDDRGYRRNLPYIGVLDPPKI